MKVWKARVITALITILFVVLAADVVALRPGTLPYILGVFAVPGVVWFSRLLYRWVTEDDEEKTIVLPTLWSKKATRGYADYRGEADD